VTVPSDLLPTAYVDPVLTAAGAAALAGDIRRTTYAQSPQDWHPEDLRHLLANVAVCPLSPEALAATAVAASRLAALLEAVQAMDVAALALARHLEGMGPGAAGA